jgi:3-deoxy-manno-octulosonate cytidylyltransferase (CMP-KDO synthetase)
MTKIAIIIPSRLEAQRLPNKPLELIENKEMILHVYDQAVSAQIGEVIVATPDQKIIDIVKSHGGKVAMTQKVHKTGTDRIFEVFEKELKKETEIIINLQGDMPNIDPSVIKDVANHMKNNTCDIGTIASDIRTEKEIIDPNVCKVVTTKKISKDKFASALDFYRLSKKPSSNLTYHHIGIYAFTNPALIRYVGLERSKLEQERKLEQLRALENDMKIEVGYTSSYPLSVDTEEDLINIKQLMKK